MASTSPLMLSIDLGTSGVKAACVQEDGTILSTGKARISTIRLPGHGAEQDAHKVWQAVLDACKQAIAGSEGRAGDIIGVGACSQFSSIIPVDKEGQPTMNMVVWQDQRGAPATLRKYPEARGVRDNLLRQLRWVRIHGIPPLDSGIDSLSHMRFVRFAHPDVYERTRYFLEPMDFVTMRLTGRATANQCSAFLMCLADNRKAGESEWSDTLLRWSGIGRDKLPELIGVDEQVGVVLPEVARELGIGPDVKVYAGINDTQAGGMAAYAFSGSHAGMTIGTTGAITTHVDFKRTDIRNSMVSMPSPVKGEYFVMAENGIAGRAVEHFLENIVFSQDGYGDHSLEDKFSALHHAIDGVPPGSGGVLFLPWMNGSFTPIEEAAMRGGFLNISLETTREHLGLAVLEGVAYNFRWLKETVEGFAKRRFTHMVFYGGGALSDVWCQVIADVLGVPVHQLIRPQYTACLGVGLTCFHRAGRLPLESFAERVPVKQVHEPRPENAAVHGAQFAQFIEAFKRNRKIFRSLNPLTR